MTALEIARADLATAETAVTTAEHDRTAAREQLDRCEAATRAAHTFASSIRQHIGQLEREPHDAELLTRRLTALRGTLRTIPPHSSTGQRVRRELSHLEASDGRVSDRLNLVTSLLHDARNHYSADRRIWDAKTPPLAGRGG